MSCESKCAKRCARERRNETVYLASMAAVVVFVWIYEGWVKARAKYAVRSTQHISPSPWNWRG